MNTSRITSLAPDGRPPYASKNGLLYGYRIAFEDGAAGLVNTKTEIPPYKVGDSMTYEITGKAGQNDKMKVSKPKDGAWTPPPAVQLAPPHDPDRLPGLPEHQPAKVTVHGATVGMAVKEAIALANARAGDGKVMHPDQTDFWGKVHQYASAIIRLSNALEHGNLTPALGSKPLPLPKEPARREVPPDDDVPF